MKFLPMNSVTCPLIKFKWSTSSILLGN